jgi:DNA-binding transcriptional regulator YiaG
MVDIAEAFDAAIRRRMLTNQEVAWELGATEKTVTRWRTGVSHPRPRFLRRILEFIDEPANGAAA